MRVSFNMELENMFTGDDTTIGESIREALKIEIIKAVKKSISSDKRFEQLVLKMKEEAINKALGK